MTARTELELATIDQSTTGHKSSPSAIQADDPKGWDDPFESRFQRLTPREVRVLILVVAERLDHEELGVALGTSRANIANIMQGVRRKLAVPVRMDLQTFIRTVPSLASLVEASKPPEIMPPASEERRRHDLLRVTINELQSVAGRARRRASNLEALLSYEDESVEHEAFMVRHVAEVIDAAIAEVLRKARQIGRPASTGVGGERGSGF